MRRLPRAGVRAAATLALGLGTAARAPAQISPGELSAAHAAIDGSGHCLDCHSRGRPLDPARCLACHGALGERLRAGAGLHARPEYGECAHCHIEHQGRDFALISWGEGGERAFVHSLTGYSLTGAHAVLGCRDCHRLERVAEPSRLRAGGANPGRSFLGLASGCDTCHRDPHRGQFADRGCAACHDSAAWKPAVSFAHDRTSFRLTGGHAAVACARCHASDRTAGGAVRYRGVGTACADCHSDPHAGRLGAACANCHSAAGWRRAETAAFDHAKTRYPLRGRHATISCAACHVPGRRLQIPDFGRCATCHADVHAGQFRSRPGGGECAECHHEAGWVPSLFTAAEHARTTYPLAGAHLTVRCADCHAAAGAPSVRRFRLAATGCADCHRDPHDGPALRGAVGCASCHTVAAWRAVEFDHSPTGFTIAGAHRRLRCRDCHRPAQGQPQGAAPRFLDAPSDCAGCHADPHLGQFDRPRQPAPCAACHGEDGWAAWRFDHQRDAGFALDGAHRAVACIGCHPRERHGDRLVTRFRPLASGCADCHGQGVPR